MQVVQKVLVARTADEVWEIVGRRFGDVATWAAAVDVSRPIDGTGSGGASCAGRACTVAVPGFAELTEELTAYDDRARTLTYRATSGMPGFVREARNTWAVAELSADTCAFTMHAEVELSPLGSLAGPALRLYLSRIGRVTGRDLKTFAETGRPHGSRVDRGVPTLRLPVAVNAAFSGLCGLLLVTGADTWARHLGSNSSVLTDLLGTALLGYGLGLALLLLRGVPASAGRTLAGLDAAWVAATVALLAVVGNRFTTAGIVATLGTSLVVGALGWWQWSAARRTPAPVRQSGQI